MRQLENGWNRWKSQFNNNWISSLCCFFDWKINNFIEICSFEVLDVYNCSEFKTIEFSENTETISIDDYTFYGSSIESINIASSKLELGDGGWIQQAYNLKDIIISPSNKNYQYKNNSYFLGKSDQLSDNYDVLIFCKRDIETAIIPSNIKFLFPCSFAYCSRLKTIEFSEDSELLSIGSGTFYKSAIENISII